MPDLQYCFLSPIINKKLSNESVLAAQYFRKHNPVSNKAIARILEGGWFVLFNKEMTKPGKTITSSQAGEKPSPVHRLEKHYQTAKGKPGTNKVKQLG